MNGDDFTERVKGFTPEQHGLLRHIIDVLIDIVANPEVPAVLLHAKLLDADSAVVVAHCLSRDGEEADRMLFSFLQARKAAADMAESIPPNEPRH